MHPTVCSHLSVNYGGQVHVKLCAPSIQVRSGTHHLLSSQVLPASILWCAHTSKVICILNASSSILTWVWNTPFSSPKDTASKLICTVAPKTSSLLDACPSVQTRIWIPSLRAIISIIIRITFQLVVGLVPRLQRQLENETIGPGVPR